MIPPGIEVGIRQTGHAEEKLSTAQGRVPGGGNADRSVYLKWAR